MSIHTYIARIKHIDHLIRTKATGNIETLSKKLHLSKIGVYKFLKDLKEIGIIVLSHLKKSISTKIKSFE